MFSDRDEAHYKLALVYKLENNILMSELLLDSIINKEKPIVIDIIEDNIYEFFIPCLYTEIKILLGKYDVAIKQLNRKIAIGAMNMYLNLVYQSL